MDIIVSFFTDKVFPKLAILLVVGTTFATSAIAGMKLTGDNRQD